MLGSENRYSINYPSQKEISFLNEETNSGNSASSNNSYDKFKHQNKDASTDSSGIITVEGEVYLFVGGELTVDTKKILEIFEEEFNNERFNN